MELKLFTVISVVGFAKLFKALKRHRGLSTISDSGVCHSLLTLGRATFPEASVAGLGNNGECNSTDSDSV
jgi:hypothetical protein